MTYLRNNQSGSLSMLTVIFLSLIMILVSLATISVMVRERREATDNQLSTQAFYAAESGIEDAIEAINRANSGSGVTLNSDTCAPATWSGSGANQNVLDTQGPVSYTCQLIDDTPGNIRLSLPANGPSSAVKLLAPSGGNTPSSIVVNWHLRDAAPSAVPVANADAHDVAVRNVSETNLLRDDEWCEAENNCSIDLASARYPAMMRLALYSLPNSGAISKANIDNNAKIVYLNPADGAGDVSVANLEPTGSQNNPVSADCSVKGVEEYVCSMRISGLNANRTYTLRLGALYSGTQVEIEMLDSADQPLEFVGAQTLVDVTGRANDVLRRLEARVATTPSLRDFLPDRAVITGDDLCKDLSIVGPGPSGVIDNCP